MLFAALPPHRHCRLTFEAADRAVGDWPRLSSVTLRTDERRSQVRERDSGEQSEYHSYEHQHGEEVATADGDHHTGQQEGDDCEQCDDGVESFAEGFVHVRGQTADEKKYCGHRANRIYPAR